MRLTNQPKERKNLNDLGKSYKQSGKAKQLRFRALLLEASERDDFDYWRSFRDIWQYSDNLNRTPFVIVRTAAECFDYQIANS